MNTARAYHTLTFLTNGMVLAAGGSQGSSLAANAELYNPSPGTWSITGSLNTAREVQTAILLPSGLVLAAGGDGVWPASGFNNNAALTSAELYNPATGTWQNAASLLTSCYGQSATLLPSGAVLVAGGRSTNALFTAASEIYTPFPGISFAGFFSGISPSLLIQGVIGYNYAIQDTTNLADSNAWVTVTNLTLTQQNKIFVDTNTDASLPTNPLRFYRVASGQ